MLWSGDELALRNDPDWAAEPGHGDDNRWAARPRLPWEIAARRHDPLTVEGRVFTGLRHLAGIRARLPHLHAAVPAEVVPEADPGVLSVLRRHPVGPLLGLYSVTGDWRPWPAWRLGEYGLDDPLDALSGTAVHPGDDGNLWLPSYAAWWLLAS